MNLAKLDLKQPKILLRVGLEVKMQIREAVKKKIIVTDTDMSVSATFCPLLLGKKFFVDTDQKLASLIF